MRHHTSSNLRISTSSRHSSPYKPKILLTYGLNFDQILRIMWMRSIFLAFVGSFHFIFFSEFSVFILRRPAPPLRSHRSRAVWQHPVGGLAVLSFQRRPSSGTSLASKPRRVLDSHLRSTLSTCPRADRTITKSFYVFRAPTRRSRVVASERPVATTSPNTPNWSRGRTTSRCTQRTATS
jgi:hypothetical protein